MSVCVHELMIVFICLSSFMLVAVQILHLILGILCILFMFRVDYASALMGFGFVSEHGLEVVDVPF